MKSSTLGRAGSASPGASMSIRSSRPSVHIAAMASGCRVRTGGDDHPGGAGQRELVDERGRQDVQVVGVVDDQQQIALRSPLERRPGRAQQRGGLPDVGDIHQVAEGAERDHPLGRGAGDPADERVGMLAGRSVRRPTGPAWICRHRRVRAPPRRGRADVAQGNIQLLQGRRVLRDVPSNRHQPDFIARRAGRCELARLRVTVRALVYLGGYAPGRDSSREWAVCVYCASGPTHPELLEVGRRTRRGDRRARLDAGVGRRPCFGDGRGGQSRRAHAVAGPSA